MKRTSTDRLLGEAQRALESGRPDQARILLEAAARQDKADPRPWLMLAGIATSARERRAFLHEADRLREVSPSAVGQAAPVLARGRSPWLMRSALVVVLVAVFLLSGLFVTRHPTGNAWVQGVAAQLGDPAQATSDAASIAASGSTAGSDDPVGLEQSPALDASPATEAGAGEDLPPTAAAALSTSVPASGDQSEPASDAELPPKQVVSGVEPRATWTVTPQPTPTLAPTATPTATPEPTPTPVPPPPGSPRPYGVGVTEKWINVDLATQTLTAYEGDTPVFNTLISSGTWEFPTVTGQFRTYLKYEKQTMNGYLLGYDYYLPDVPYVMYFYGDYAIHGTFWHSNFGTPMSHGCVNTSPEDAAWLFNWAPIGTLVNVN